MSHRCKNMHIMARAFSAKTTAWNLAICANPWVQSFVRHIPEIKSNNSLLSSITWYDTIQIHKCMNSPALWHLVKDWIQGDHPPLQVGHARGPRFGSIMQRGSLGSHAVSTVCCFHNPSHNGQLSEDSHKLRVYKSFYSQKSPVHGQQLPILMAHSMRQRWIVSCIRRPWTNYGHNGMSRDYRRHESWWLKPLKWRLIWDSFRHYQEWLWYFNLENYRVFRGSHLSCAHLQVTA